MDSIEQRQDNQSILQHGTNRYQKRLAKSTKRKYARSENWNLQNKIYKL